jgi:hypothetical protein
MQPDGQHTHRQPPNFDGDSAVFAERMRDMERRLARLEAVVDVIRRVGDTGHDAPPMEIQ